MKKIIIVIGLFLLILFGYKYPYILLCEYQNNAPNNLSFDYQKPNSDGGKSFTPYVESKNWKHDNTFFVEIVIPANCGDYYWLGSYHIVKNNLRLEYKALSDGVMPCGACPVHLFYTIEGIEKQEYNITISSGIPD